MIVVALAVRSNGTWWWRISDLLARRSSVSLKIPHISLLREEA